MKETSLSEKEVSVYDIKAGHILVYNPKDVREAVLRLKKKLSYDRGLWNVETIEKLIDEIFGEKLCEEGSHKEN